MKRTKTKTETQGEDDQGTMEAEIEVMYSIYRLKNTEDHQLLPEAKRGAWNRFSLRTLRGKPFCSHPEYKFLDSKTVKWIHFCHFDLKKNIFPILT